MHSLQQAQQTGMQEDAIGDHLQSMNEVQAAATYAYTCLYTYTHVYLPSRQAVLMP